MRAVYNDWMFVNMSISIFHRSLYIECVKILGLKFSINYYVRLISNLVFNIWGGGAFQTFHHV